VLGDPPRSRGERTDRFVEWLALLDQLLREPVTTVTGKRFSAVEAYQLPGCVQVPRVPFTVAAAGPRAFALAARFGQAWVTHGPYGPPVGPDEWFDALAAQSARLDTALAGQGRAREDVRRVAQLSLDVRWPFASAERYADTLGRLAELGFSEVTVHWSRPDGRGLPADARPIVAAAHGL